MCDHDHWGCQTHRPSHLCDQNDHCHFEQYQQETRGPLHRTSTSTLRGCHRPNHNTSHHCNSGTRCNSHISQRDCCNNHCQEHSILYDLESLFGQRRRDSDLANILDRVCRSQQNNTDSQNNNNSSSNNNNRGVLRQLLDEVLGSNSNSNSNINNRNNRSSNTSTSSDRDVLVDLLLRITSNSSTSTNTLPTNLDNPPPYNPHYAGRRVDDLATTPHFIHLQNAWLARNTIPAGLPIGMEGVPLHYSYTQPNLGMYGLGMPTMATPWAAMYASRGQVPPRWLGGR